MGDSPLAALPQGFYIFTGGRWVLQLRAPLDHVLTLSGKPVALLNRGVAYVDEAGWPHVAMSGLVVDISIPRVFWPLVGHPYGVYLFPAIIHDWYCAKALTVTGSERKALSAKGDALFYEMCSFVTPQKDVGPFVFAQAVKVGSFIRQFRPVAPDYETQLEAYYLWEDVPHMTPIETERRRHE